ncbi:unnamed protein product, partial [Brassica oleracea var. botrytis]
LKRALDLFSPVHGQFPPPDAEAEEKSFKSKAERKITIKDSLPSLYYRFFLCQHDSFWLKLESGFSLIKSISVRRIW